MKNSNKKNNFYTQRQPFTSRLLLIVWCLVSSTGSVLAVYTLDQRVMKAILESFSLESCVDNAEPLDQRVMKAILESFSLESCNDVDQKLRERQLMQLLLEITPNVTGASSAVSTKTCQDWRSGKTAIYLQMLVKLAKVLAEKIPWIQSEKDSRCELAKGYAPYVEKVLRALEGLEIMYLVEIDLLGWMEQYASVVLRDKQKALEYQKQICDNSYSVLVHNCKKLASAQRDAGQYKEALASMKQALKIQQVIAGEDSEGNPKDDPKVADLFGKVGELYTSIASEQQADETAKQQINEEALQYTQRALAMRRRLLQKQRRLNLGSFLASDPHLASLLEQEGPDVPSYSEEDDHPDVAGLLMQLGVCYENLKRPAKAALYQKQGQEMQKRLHEKEARASSRCRTIHQL